MKKIENNCKTKEINIWWPDSKTNWPTERRSQYNLKLELELLKLQYLQNKVLRATGKCSRCTRVSDLHQVSSLPSMCHYLCGQQTEVLHNHENEHFRSRGEGVARYRKYKRFIFGGDKYYDRSSD
jgi:hypothetical protein